MNIPETDRWLIDGDCTKCRRKDYCKKECTSSKRAMESLIRNYIRKRIGIDRIQEVLEDGSFNDGREME